MLNFIKTVLFYTAIMLCILFGMYGVCNSALLKQIKTTGGITVYDEFYACTYKGKVN